MQSLSNRLTVLEQQRAEAEPFLMCIWFVSPSKVENRQWRATYLCTHFDQRGGEDREASPARVEAEVEKVHRDGTAVVTFDLAYGAD